MARESLFKNKYKLSNEVLKEFVKTSTKGTRLVGLFGVAMALYFAYTEIQRDSMALVVSLIIIAVVALVYSIMLPTITMKNMEKEDDIFKDINKDIIIDIGFNNMIINVDNKERKVFYSDIISILENKDYFYLMQSKTKGIIIGKNDFIDGTPEEFKNFIQTKFVKPKSTGG